MAETVGHLRAPVRGGAAAVQLRGLWDSERDDRGLRRNQCSSTREGHAFPSRSARLQGAHPPNLVDKGCRRCQVTDSRSDARDRIGRHVLERRSEARVPLKYGVECEGASGRHDGELLDLSQHGALLAFMNPRFQAADDLALVAAAERLSHEFGVRMLVRFQGPAVALNARLVRTARDAQSRRTVVACVFDRPLSARECRLLRVRFSERDERS